MPRRRRTAAKLLRFHPEELAAITARAHACGMAPARFIREVALGVVPEPRRGTRNDDAVRELAQLANTLRQLADDPRGEQDSPARATLAAVIAEILDAVRRLG